MALVEVWSPAPGSLFTLPETATSVSHSISLSITDDGGGTPPTVVGYSVTVTPEQSVVSVSSSPSGVVLSAAALAGIIPIQFVRYLLDGAEGEVYEWGDLPAAAEEVTGFQPSNDPSRIWSVEVVANLSDSTTRSASYTFTVTNDWTAGRDRLVSEVDARR